MEIAIGVGGAVRGNQQMGILKIGGVRGYQFDLAGPLGQLAGNGGRPGLDGGIPFDGFGIGTGASAGERATGMGFRLLDGFLIISGRFPFLKGDGSGGTGGQTIAQSVAVILAGEFGFSVYHLDGALVAGGGTGTASVALFFIYRDNFANHVLASLLC